MSVHESRATDVRGPTNSLFRLSPVREDARHRADTGGLNQEGVDHNIDK